MIKWRLIFILLSCILIWCNDWSKVNCNYQIHLRNTHPDWENLTVNKRIYFKIQDEQNLPFSFSTPIQTFIGCMKNRCLFGQQ